MEKRLLDALVGVSADNEQMVVFNHGVANYPALHANYEANMVFDGDAKKIIGGIRTPIGKSFFAAYGTKGYGIRFQKESIMPEDAIFCMAVVSKEISANNKKLDGLDPKNPDNDTAVMDINRDSIALKEISKRINARSILKDAGNNLKAELTKLKGHVRIVGNDGVVSIFVSRSKIVGDNHGELIGTFNNSCDDDFEIIGEIMGLQGAVSNISDKHYCCFHLENDNIYIWQTWFDGKEHFDNSTLTHGQLVQPYLEEAAK